jgi:fructose-1,6-bisphosphatase/sedoheptulose 1,7-bisphosphatase-like protein
MLADGVFGVDCALGVILDRRRGRRRHHGVCRMGVRTNIITGGDVMEVIVTVLVGMVIVTLVVVAGMSS